VKYDRSKISPSIVAEMTCTKEFFSLQCRSKKNIRFRGDSLVPNLPESDSPELTRLLRRAAVIQLVAEDSLSKLLDRILALDMMESRLGVGWKSVLLRRLCDEGRIRAVNARLTHSPSTPPIRTSEFFIADLRMFSRFVGYDPAWWLPWLW